MIHCNITSYAAVKRQPPPPTLQGATLAYPFMPDFYIAVLMSAGWDMHAGEWQKQQCEGLLALLPIFHW